MPCNSDYLNATDLEKNLSEVYQLLDELNGKKLPKNFGDGYDRRVYNNGLTKKDLDKKVAELCGKLKKVKDISKHSLEMQVWWRDHQKADKERIAEEKNEKSEKKLKKQALAKLSEKEKKALGI